MTLLSKCCLTWMLKTCICLYCIASWAFVTLAVQPCCQQFWSICCFIHCGLLSTRPPFIFSWKNSWSFHLNLFWFLLLYLLKLASHLVASVFIYCYKNVPDTSTRLMWFFYKIFFCFLNIRNIFNNEYSRWYAFLCYEQEWIV